MMLRRANFQQPNGPIVQELYSAGFAQDNPGHCAVMQRNKGRMSDFCFQNLDEQGACAVHGSRVQ